jgi:hypothetical protein
MKTNYSRLCSVNMYKMVMVSLILTMLCSCQNVEPLNVKSDFCRLAKRTELIGGHASITYTWKDNTRTGDGTITEYNDYGSITRYIEENGHNYTFEYDDCENFCRLTKKTEESTLGDRIVTNYTWDGNIQTSDDGTITEYNDYGSKTKQIQGQRISTWQYTECENFCKMVSSSAQEHQFPLTETKYSWDGNVQTSEYGTITEYNQQGHIIRYQMPNGHGYTYKYTDCE